jgi:VWFA-related protein
VPPLAAVSLAAFSFLAVAARSQDEAGRFSETLEVEVVNVEVTVTDRDGRPVDGLTRDDFEVLEDGEPVPLTHFFAVEDRRVVAPAAAAGGLGPPPEPETRRLNLVAFVDDLNIRPENRNLLFRDLEDYISSRLDPRDRVMVVHLDNGVEVAQPFTDDRQQLLAALQRLSSRVGKGVQLDSEHRVLLSELQRASVASRSEGGGRNSLSAAADSDFQQALLTAERLAGEVRVLATQRYERVRAAVAALSRFTDSLAGLPGRKAVLYLSDGLPVRPADSLVAAWVAKYEAWIAANGEQGLMGRLTSMTSSEFDLTQDFSRLVEHAAANGVVFYPISVAGRTAPAALSAEYAGGASGSGRGPLSADVVQLEASSRESSLLAMADGTGGVALTGSQNLDALLARMAHDFTSFYSLGYEPPPSAAGEGLRRVEVRVKRDGVRVRHLEGYRKKDPAEILGERTLAALYYGIGDNPLAVELEPAESTATGKDRYRVSVLVKIPFDKLLLLPREQAHVARVSLVVVAGDGAGGVSPEQRIEVPVEIPNDRLPDAVGQFAAYPLQIEMRKGRQRLAVGAFDQLARVGSTVTVDLDVGGGGG